MLYDGIEMTSSGSLIIKSGGVLPDIGMLGEMFVLTSNQEIETYIYGKKGWVKMAGSSANAATYVKEFTVKNTVMSPIIDLTKEDSTIIKVTMMFRNDSDTEAQLRFDSKSLGTVQENIVAVGETLVLKMESVLDVTLFAKAKNLYVKVAIN